MLAGRGAARTKARKIERLVGLVADTWSLNPGKNLLELDHSPDSAGLDSLELPDVDDDDRELILSNLRAQQRAYRTGRGAATGLKLLDAGFDAARKIVALNPDEFVKASGLPPQEAVAVHYAATKESTAAATKSIAIYQLAHAHAPGPARTAEETIEAFAKIPGYSTLFPDDFGFCDCDECGSVLGLPAYFVDTMFFVDKHILDYIPTEPLVPSAGRGATTSGRSTSPAKTRTKSSRTSTSSMRFSRSTSRASSGSRRAPTSGSGSRRRTRASRFPSTCR